MKYFKYFFWYVEPLTPLNEVNVNHGRMQDLAPHINGYNQSLWKPNYLMQVASGDGRN